MKTSIDLQLRLNFGKLLCLAATVVLWGLGHTQDSDAAAPKPNVVFILADDLGFSDTTLFQTTRLYQTPNIERLASRGMVFSHSYSSSPLCSPTRSSILTGQSPARTGITAPVCHLPDAETNATPGVRAAPNQKAILPNSATRLGTDHYTLAEMFRDNGYKTAHFGKWHLGPEPFSPLEHGFDVDIPHWPGPGPAGNYVAPWNYPDFDPQTPDEHIEDRMAEEAVAFMQKHRDQPFFLNYWMFSVHAPFDAKQDLIDKYRKRIDPSDPQRSPTYAAMVESMDDAIGTLIDALDQLGIAENTIVIFASDNGGNMYNEVDGTTATSNAPLRGGKATMYEGGIRGPGIVVYPNVVQAGSRSREVIQSSDFYPTLLEMLGVDAKPDQVFDGISIVPALSGASLNREAIFTFFPHSPGIPEWLPPAVSVHRGAWKLIRLFHYGENGQHRYKLFDLESDVGEQQDVSADHPELVAELDAMIEQFLDETGAVLPTPNPRFKPASYDASLEGKAKLKSSQPRRTTMKPKMDAKPVAGWQPNGTCELSTFDNKLVVKSTGNDPHFIYEFASDAVDPNAGTKTYELRFEMKSQSAGPGQVFWHEQNAKPPYIGKRSVMFNANHDGNVHAYVVPFNANHPVIGVRIDPSKSAGQMTLSNVQLFTADGKLVHRWSF